MLTRKDRYNYEKSLIQYFFRFPKPQKLDDTAQWPLNDNVADQRRSQVGAFASYRGGDSQVSGLAHGGGRSFCLHTIQRFICIPPFSPCVFNAPPVPTYTYLHGLVSSTHGSGCSSMLNLYPCLPLMDYPLVIPSWGFHVGQKGYEF